LKDILEVVLGACSLPHDGRIGTLCLHKVLPVDPITDNENRKDKLSRDHFIAGWATFDITAVSVSYVAITLTRSSFGTE
jgi:hypothetical protein